MARCGGKQGSGGIRTGAYGRRLIARRSAATGALGAALCAMLLLLPGARTAAAWERIGPRQAEGMRVAEIRFHYPGDKAYKSSELRSAMRIRVGERFPYRYFRGDLAALVALYQSRGYREAAITRKQLTVDAKKRLHLDITLDSGPRWYVSGVRLLSTGAVPQAELRQRVRLRAGDDLDYGRVLADERTLQVYLNQRGYARATVRNEWVDHAQSHTTEVIFHVDAGRRMRFGAVTIQDGERLHTHGSLVRRYLSFAPGDLYDPEKLARSRQQLARTELFRSVFFTLPQTAAGDSLQPVEIRLQERKRISLEANAYLKVTSAHVAPRLFGSIQHNNWLGRGMKLGTDVRWGQPLQGATVYMMERDVARTGADLVLSVGGTEEWGATQVYADPNDPRQYELLTTNDSVLEGLLWFAGEDVVDEYIRTVVYDYTSIQRLLHLSGTLSRRWHEIYQAQLKVDFTRARNFPDPDADIRYSPSDLYAEDGGDPFAGEDPFGGDDPFGGEDPFAGDDSFGSDDPFSGSDPFGGNSGVIDDGTSGTGDPFADADPFADGGGDDLFPGDDSADVAAGEGDGTPTAGDAAAGARAYVDYSEGRIAVTPLWTDILTERSRSINLSTEFVRDSRDDRIAPTRGTFLRLGGLYAVKLGARSTHVLDGEAELRAYHRLSRHLVVAVAGQYSQTASLRSERTLPQVYWKRYGGEGSLRGVERDDIVAVGGGRVGINLRAELRFQAGRFGLVGFLDRANVWRHFGDVAATDLVRPGRMVDGYGLGARYVVGFPFRLDVAFNDGYDRSERMRVYFSIGQAF